MVSADMETALPDIHLWPLGVSRADRPGVFVNGAGGFTVLVLLEVSEDSKPHHLPRLRPLSRHPCSFNVRRLRMQDIPGCRSPLSRQRTSLVAHVKRACSCSSLSRWNSCWDVSLVVSTFLFWSSRTSVQNCRIRLASVDAARMCPYRRSDVGSCSMRTHFMYQ